MRSPIFQVYVFNSEVWATPGISSTPDVASPDALEGLLETLPTVCACLELDVERAPSVVHRVLLERYSYLVYFYTLWDSTVVVTTFHAYFERVGKLSMCHVPVLLWLGGVARRRDPSSRLGCPDENVVPAPRSSYALLRNINELEYRLPAATQNEMSLGYLGMQRCFRTPLFQRLMMFVFVDKRQRDTIFRWYDELRPMVS